MALGPGPGYVTPLSAFPRQKRTGVVRKYLKSAAEYDSCQQEKPEVDN